MCWNVLLVLLTLEGISTFQVHPELHGQVRVRTSVHIVQGGAGVLQQGVQMPYEWPLYSERAKLRLYP